MYNMQKLTIIQKPNLPKAFIYYLLVYLYVRTLCQSRGGQRTTCESVLSLHHLGPGVKSKCSELGAFPN